MEGRAAVLESCSELYSILPRERSLFLFVSLLVFNLRLFRRQERANKLTNARANIIHRFELARRYNEISLPPRPSLHFTLTLLLFVCFSSIIGCAVVSLTMSAAVGPGGYFPSGVSIHIHIYIYTHERRSYRCFSKCSSGFRC